MTYSTEHRVAFAKYLDNPHTLRSMSENELGSLLEDKNFVAEVTRERERRAQMVAPLPPAPAPVVKTAAPADDAADNSGHWAGLIEKYGAQPARKSLVFRFAGTLADAVRELRHASTARLAALEQRITVIEQRPAQKAAGTWRGVYGSGENYDEGALCTFQGGLWLATRENAAKPGTSDAWKLVVKSGSFNDRGTR